MKRFSAVILAVIVSMVLVAGCSGDRNVEVDIGEDGVKVKTKEGDKKVDIEVGEKGVHVRSEDGSMEIKGSGENGNYEYHVKTDEGEMNMEVKGEEGKMTYKAEDGEGVYEMSRDVDLSDLGVPVYKGAEVEAGTKWDKSGKDRMSARTVTMFTNDPADKVADFYKKELDPKSVVNAGGTHVLTAEDGGTTKSVMIQRDEAKNRTVIVITVAKK